MFHAGGTSSFGTLLQASGGNTRLTLRPNVFSYCRRKWRIGWRSRYILLRTLTSIRSVFIALIVNNIRVRINVKIESLKRYYYLIRNWINTITVHYFEDTIWKILYTLRSRRSPRQLEAIGGTNGSQGGTELGGTVCGASQRSVTGVVDRALAMGRVSRASNGTLRLRAPEAAPQCMYNCLSSHESGAQRNHLTLIILYFQFDRVAMKSLLGISVAVEAAAGALRRQRSACGQCHCSGSDLRIHKRNRLRRWWCQRHWCLLNGKCGQQVEAVRRVLCTSSGIEA